MDLLAGASYEHRIRLAHLFDPVLAVHTSMVEPLPHQITAVYEDRNGLTFWRWVGSNQSAGRKYR
jgi:hypothetical protein